MIFPIRRWLTPARAAIACGAVLLLLAAIGRRATGANPDDLRIGPLICTAVTFVAAAVKVLTVPAGRLTGRLMMAAGLAAAAYTVAAGWAAVPVLRWWYAWAWWLPDGLAICALLTTPAGRRPSRDTRAALLLTAATASIAAVLLAADAAIDFKNSAFFLPGMLAIVLTHVFLLWFAAVLVTRWRHAAPGTREYLAWSLAAAAVIVAKLILDMADSAEGDALPVAMAGCLAMAALTVDNPYRVVTDLGETLERRLDPQTLLPALTACLARSLRVPYVAIELTGPHGPEITAAHGTAATVVETFAMVTHGEHLGHLLVAPPAGTRRFTDRECRLLHTLARQAAIAARTAQLDHDLQASRQRLVTAREEERRRLRRDLHDGLGPSLVGMAMQVRAARRHLSAHDPAAAILTGLDTDLQTCTGDVRRLVDRLRPAALDCGLVPALRAECRRFDSSACTVELVVDGPVDALPAAAEVAAYRVVSEALTNVTRHAGAQRCRVRVTCADNLVIDITDDGAGLPHPIHPGVGLSSMRERAAELGGHCTIAPASPRGTTVHLQLPMTRVRTPEESVS